MLKESTALEPNNNACNCGDEQGKKCNRIDNRIQCRLSQNAPHAVNSQLLLFRYNYNSSRDLTGGEKKVLRLSIKNAFEEVKPGPSHDFSFIMPVYVLREVFKVCFFKV